MSMWLTTASLMRPSIPDWLEALGSRLHENDPNLTSVEISHQRIADIGVKYLSKAIDGNTYMTILVMSLFNVVDDGAYALGQVVGASRTIKKLQFRDLRHSREAMTLFRAIATNDSIEEFSLRHCRICIKSAEELGTLLRHHQSIREFRLVDSPLMNTLRPLADGIKFNGRLARLYLINNELGSAEAVILGDMLAVNTAIQELQLCENNLSDEGLGHLCKGLGTHNVTLKILNVRSNGIGPTGAAALATFIRLSTLTHLHLGSNALCDEGMKRLSIGLEHNATIVSLDVSDNEVTAIGAHSLANMVNKNDTLSELNLSVNHIGDDGAEVFSKVLANDHSQKLARLCLRRNRITNAGATHFAFRLPAMRGLQELILSKNQIDVTGIELLIQGLRSNMELEYLHIEDSDLSLPILKELHHWIRLNRAGRRIFRTTNLGAGLWPVVLAKVSNEMDVLYNFLINKPEFVQQRHVGQCKKRKLPCAAMGV